MTRRSLALSILSFAALASAALAFPPFPGGNGTPPDNGPVPCLVQVLTPDIDRSETWYRTNLGFETRKRMESDDHSVLIRILELNGFSLELVQTKDSVPARDVAPELSDRTLLQGLVKLSFETGEIEAATARLKRNGVRLRMDVSSNEASRDKFNLFYVGDGNLLQLIQKSSTKPGAPLKPCIIGLLVPEAASAARWYVEKLGFTEGKTYGGADLKVVFLESGDFKLEVVQDARSVSSEKLRPGLDRMKVQGLTKAGYVVPDLDALASRLRSSGVKIEYDLTADPEFGTRFMIILDPEGNSVQLFSNPLRFND